jgi:hypothetical protein
MEISTFVTMALVIVGGHTLSPEAKKKLVVGGKLSARPKVPAAWYVLMSTKPDATTVDLLTQLGCEKIEGDVVKMDLPSMNWPSAFDQSKDLIRDYVRQ